MVFFLLIIAVLPSFGSQGSQFFQTEVSAGTLNKKIVPIVKDTALLLLGIYAGLTFLEVILLMFAGLNFFEATIHSFGTIATGGFSSFNTSLGHYTSIWVHYIVIVFMFLAGANFILRCRFVLGDHKVFFKNDEFKFYLFFVLGVTAVITWDIWGSVFSSLEEAFRMALFHVVSVMTTTGFVISDFDLWPHVGRMFIFVLLFVGGCVGSTGSALKIARVYIMIKSFWFELLKVIHPNLVREVTIEKKIIPVSTIRKILRFINF